MRLGFLQLSAADRRLYIEQAAARRDVSAVIVEKDFWVSWLLGVLFNSEFSDSLVFKGGTSLSKVFKIIERFSEDIDLSLSPNFLNLPPVGSSKTQAEKWMRRAEVACGEAVETRIAPVLEAITASILGDPPGRWFEFRIDPETRSPVLLFHYPTTLPAGFPYLARAVKLEFGSLTDQQPTGRHPIQPLIADILPGAFADWRCEVVALEIERSFWEKATILHVEYHRPESSSTSGRYSRHYADTAALASHPTATAALNAGGLRERVVDWKSRFFPSGWAHYDLACPGSFRLVPPPGRVARLRADYDAMRDMYLSVPLPFDDVIATLSALEERINRS